MKRSCGFPGAVLGLVILSLACASSNQTAREETDSARRRNAPPRDLSAIIIPIQQTGAIPALGGAIVTSRGLEAIGAAGLRSAGSNVPVTSGDQWHIGSCGKAITATLAARLIERGVLSWETTIGQVLGPDIHAAWKDVPLLWLLAHRSGASMNLSEELWQEMAARGGSPREQRRFFVMQGLKTIPPATMPNTATVYSNAGYLIAGVMLETLTDTAWEELVQREVFAPLGMTRTGLGAPGTPGKLDQPLGHIRGEAGWSPVALGPRADNPPAGGPAGTVHTTLADWARFISAHLAGERGDERFLKAESWRKLHAAAAPDWDYSAGWVVTEADWAGGTLLRHLGSNGFWVAEASIAPDKDFAMLIVTNVGDDAAEAPFKKLLAALVADREAANSGTVQP
jgi:CubicO group peptidase (beta-lactamase class C family)